VTIRNLGDDEKSTGRVYTPDGIQELFIITEPGLYTKSQLKYSETYGVSKTP
jgi:hypothetical protein